MFFFLEMKIWRKKKNWLIYYIRDKLFRKRRLFIYLFIYFYGNKQVTKKRRKKLYAVMCGNQINWKYNVFLFFFWNLKFDTLHTLEIVRVRLKKRRRNKWRTNLHFACIYIYMYIFIWMNISRDILKYFCTSNFMLCCLTRFESFH